MGIVYIGLLIVNLGAFSANLGTFSADLEAFNTNLRTFSANIEAFSAIKLGLRIISTIRGKLRVIRIVYAELGLNRSINHYKILEESNQNYRGV